MESSDCANGSVDNCTDTTYVYHARIVITVESALGLGLELIILAILVWAKAYKSFFQRLLIWTVLALMIVDITRVTCLSHERLPSKMCAVLAFFQFWSNWCVYIFLPEILLSLHIMVCIQNKDYLVVTKLKRSKLSRLTLEVAITLTSISLPVGMLWYFFNGKYYYGFNGFMCGLTASNYSDIPKSSVVVSYFVTTMPQALAGLIAILSAIGMIILYCSLSSKLQSHRLARNVIKKMCVSLVVVITFLVATYITTILWRTRKSGYQNYMATLSLSLFTINIGKAVLLIGYLLTFHFSNICNPLKRLAKKNEVHNNDLRSKYGSFKESNESRMPSETRFTIRLTGEFNST